MANKTLSRHKNDHFCPERRPAAHTKVIIILVRKQMRWNTDNFKLKKSCRKYKLKGKCGASTANRHGMLTIPIFEMFFDISLLSCVVTLLASFSTSKPIFSSRHNNIFKRKSRYRKMIYVSVCVLVCTVHVHLADGCYLC